MCRCLNLPQDGFKSGGSRKRQRDIDSNYRLPAVIDVQPGLFRAYQYTVPQAPRSMQICLSLTLVVFGTSFQWVVMLQQRYPSLRFPGRMVVLIIDGEWTDVVVSLYALL